MEPYGRISNVKRLRQIVNAFVKHGLGHIVKITGLDTYLSVGKRLLMLKQEEEEVSYTNPQRMLMVFQELGPTFIKLGQILSTRRDQIPREYLLEFKKLQDDVPALPYEDIDGVFKEEFGKTMLEAFEYIDKNPLASGSIGQVHVARLKTGEDVVVKVRKPGVEHVIDADMKILYFLAHQIKRMLFKDNQMCNPVEVISEFERIIKDELNYSMEGRNIERFQHNAQNNPDVHFPKVYWEYSSTRVLVMERIIGIPIGEVQRLKEKGYELEKIASILFNLSLKQLFSDSFFHADPHPGNIIVMEDGVLGIIDCGMVGFMEEYFVNAFIDCFVGMFLKDYDMVVRGYMAVGTITEEADISVFKNDIRNFAERYMETSQDTIIISAILDDGVDVALRHKLKIPSAMFFTTKALIVVEGTIMTICPEFEFVGYCTGFAQKLIVKKSFDPKKIIKDIIGFISGMSDLSQSLPRKTLKILSMIEDEKIGVKVRLSGSEEFYHRMDSYVACIALSFISAGLGVASSLVIHAKIDPLIYGVAALGLFGYIMATILGMWVVYSIIRNKR